MIKCLACQSTVSVRNRESCPNCGLAFTPEQIQPLSATDHSFLTANELRGFTGIAPPRSVIAMRQENERRLRMESQYSLLKPDWAMMDMVTR